MNKLILGFAAVVAFSSIEPSGASAGCDKDIADRDLQIAAPLTESEIRRLIAQAERNVKVSVEQAETSGR